MVLTLKKYAPLLITDETYPGGVQHPGGVGDIRFACRVLTRYGEVVVQPEEFGDLIGYSDNLSVEGNSSSFTLRLRASSCNEELLKKIHPGMTIEVFCSRNADPLIGVVRDPSKLKRIETTPPELAQIPSAPTPGAGTVSDRPFVGGAGAGNAVGGSSSSPTINIEQAFRGGQNSLITRMVGHSEGNRSLTGGFTSGYQGHTDYGNARRNVGSFSSQHGGTPEQADARWLALLERQIPRYRQAATAAGLNPNDGRLLANFLDLYTQSPAAATGRGGFLDQMPRIARQGVTDNTLLEVRLDSYVNPATGRLDAPAFGNSRSRLAQDQRRRMGALNAVLQREVGQRSSSISAPGQAVRPTPATPIGSVVGGQAGQQVRTVPVTGTVQTQQTQQYRITIPHRQNYGVSRDGGARRHAGQDFDISGSGATAISFIGGIVTSVGVGSDYGNFVDIWNARLGVVERIAEMDVRTAQLGQTILPGQSVGRGEWDTGVFHYEIWTSNFRSAANGRQGGTGFPGTTDPVAFYRNLGIDPVAPPSRVFRNARIATANLAAAPVAGIAGGIAPIQPSATGAIAQTDYYLDQCPHLLLHGIITDHGRSLDGREAQLIINGSGYGKLYRDSTVLLDIGSPTTVGRALEVRTQALTTTAVSLIYYGLLRNWVENFWGEETGWEARTREIPLPPNYLARITEGSVWSGLESITIPGFFHLFSDHTGALCWEKLPWSGRDQALIDGRNWEDLALLKMPSWKIINWDDRLSEQGIANFVRIIPNIQGTSGGQDETGRAAMIYNMGSIRQYSGVSKREIRVPYGTSPDQWYTSAPRREAQANFQTFADLCVLESIRWNDRPVQRSNLTLRGESCWRIHTRLEVTEDWHCANAKPGQYYVVSRSHSIDFQQGSWRTQVSLVRDRRERYLGIGVGEVPIIEGNTTPQQPGEDFKFNRSAPELPGKVAKAQREKLQVPLVPDEYYWFNRQANAVVPIGNDPIKYARQQVIPNLGIIQTTPIQPPSTDTQQRSTTAGEVAPAPVAVRGVADADNPPGSYRLTLERQGRRLTEVPSPITGTVTRSMQIGGDLGHVVEVRGSDGRSWLISQLDARAVRQGQVVTRGSTLGNQRASGPLLVEVRERGVVVSDRTISRPLIDEYVRFVEGQQTIRGAGGGR